MNTKTGTNINEAISLIRSGEIVAIPTETVYGLAGNGTDEKAIQKIFKAKKRPLSNPLILHFSNLDIYPICQKPPDTCKILAEHFWPGPLTLLLDKSEIIPDMVNAVTVELRFVPNQEMTFVIVKN